MRIRIDPDGVDEIIRAGLIAMRILPEDVLEKAKITPYRVCSDDKGKKDMMGMTIDTKPPIDENAIIKKFYE